jgi:hypothetical protein
VSGTPRAVIYVAGVGHSGSTLLDLLLSSHPAVTSVGEVRELARRPGPRCTCGAPEPSACAFWQKVEPRVREAVGLPLAELDVRGTGPGFAAHNRELLAAVCEVAGRPVVVDSSKSARRLAALLATPGLAVWPVHLLRDPAAVAHSQRRKGRSGLRSAWHWRRRTAAVRAALRGVPHLELHYDALVANPAGALARVLAPVGLQTTPDQLEWAGRERHGLGGNRIRFSRDSTIEADLAWRQAMGPLARGLVRALAGR